MKRGLVEPIYYPSTGKFWCVHRWAMVRTDFAHDTYRCLKCHAESGSDLGAPPNFTNYMLPFILFIGTAACLMLWRPWSIVFGCLSFIGLLVWLREIEKNSHIDKSNTPLEVLHQTPIAPTTHIQVEEQPELEIPIGAMPIIPDTIENQR